MTVLIRRVAPLLVVALLVACGATVPPGPSAGSSRTTAVQPTLTPVPGAPSPTPARTQPPTSNPEFGPIWDALPASWPKLPGQSQSEVGSDASDQFVVNGDPGALARRLGEALTKLGWTVDIGSPLEDGTVVVDATGSPAGCRAEAQFMPPPDGSPVRLLGYYGAACPFG